MDQQQQQEEPIQNIFGNRLILGVPTNEELQLRIDEALGELQIAGLDAAKFTVQEMANASILVDSFCKELKVWTASRSQVMQRDIYAIGVKKGCWVLPDEMTPKAVINFCRFLKGPEGQKEVQGLAQAARLDKRRVGQQTRTDVAYGAIFTVQLQDWKREEKEVSAIFEEQIVDLRRQINILSLEKDREISELSKKYMPACTYTEMEREALHARGGRSE